MFHELIDDNDVLALFPKRLSWFHNGFHSVASGILVNNIWKSADCIDKFWIYPLNAFQISRVNARLWSWLLSAFLFAVQWEPGSNEVFQYSSHHWRHHYPSDWCSSHQLNDLHHMNTSRPIAPESLFWPIQIHSTSEHDWWPTEKIILPNTK